MCQYVYLSSLFSVMFNGIAFSMRTRSPADRFCKLFTSRSLLFSAHRHGIQIFTYFTINHILYPLQFAFCKKLQMRSPHLLCQRSLHCCQHDSRRCWVGQSGRKCGWRAGSVGVCTSVWCVYNTERGSLLDCVLGKRKT